MKEEGKVECKQSFFTIGLNRTPMGNGVLSFSLPLYGTEMLILYKD